MCGFSWCALLSMTSTRHYSFPKHFFELVLHISEFAKGFEIVWRVQAAHLHNAARALSNPSRCFQFKTKITNRMWFSVVYSLIDNDTRHRSGQNVMDSRGAAEWVRNKFWPLWWRVSLSIKLYTTLSHIRFVFYHNIIFVLTIEHTNSDLTLSWQLNTPTRIWKCTRCIMQMSC